MSYDPNNVFAKVLRGELPCVRVFEDAHTLAFMDIMPSVEGHTLVIPKQACESILDASDDALSASIRTTKKVAAAVKKGLGCPAVMIAQLNGAAAGQSIPHLHFHVLPRYEGLDMKLHGRTTVDAKVLESIATKIRAAL